MRKNSQRIIAGALMLTVLVSTGCSVQNSQQTVTEQQTQRAQHRRQNRKPVHLLQTQTKQQTEL